MHVLLRDAEAECFQVTNVCGVETFELAHVVLSACPLDLRKAHRICDAEVVKRAEKSPLDGIGQAYFCGDVSAEIGEDVSPIHTLWRSCEAEEDLRMKVCEKVLIGSCRCMMEFIDDDHVIVVGIHFLKETLTVQCLNGHEEAWLFHFPVLCEAGFRR